MTAALQVTLLVLFTLWILVLHANIRTLASIVNAQSDILSTLVRQRGDLLTEEVAAARAGLGQAVERLDVGRLRERVDPQERRAD